jgi:hypothetical protein
MARNPRRLYAELDAIYATIPATPCTGACYECCGPIPMTDRERRRGSDALGRTLEATGHELVCSALTADRRCAIHAVRPIICRLYGTASGLTCPYGCKPERIMSREEVADVLTRVARLCGDLGITHVMVSGARIPTEQLAAFIYAEA